MSLLPARPRIHGLPGGPYGFFIGGTPKSLYLVWLFFRQNDFREDPPRRARVRKIRRIQDKLRPKSSPFANSFMQNNL